MRNLRLTVVLLALVSGLAIDASAADQKQDRRKLLKFSHQYHQENVGATCDACHTTVMASTSAGDRLLPAMAEGCGGCHDVTDESNCKQCHYDDEATWIALEREDRGLVFNHRQHAVDLKLPCSLCHGDIAKVDYSSAANQAPMQTCMTCHDGLRASNTCSACHVAGANLRPASHGLVFISGHKKLAMGGAGDCRMCHTEASCQDCHEGAALLKFESGSTARLAPGAPNSERRLAVQRVHALDFRQTHGLEARKHSDECMTCHETKTFCADCHANGAVELRLPAWHGGPNWGAIAGAVGGGGGRHAELAKRDIEQCQACHDTNGQDPNCLFCHSDNDGVRGTDPKTHASGFANRFGGDSDFHQDKDALCFACHQSTGRRGDGFCGYCHGN